MRKKPRLQRDRTGAKKPLLKHEVELSTSLSCTERLSSRKTSLQHETPASCCLAMELAAGRSMTRREPPRYIRPVTVNDQLARSFGQQNALTDAGGIVVAIDNRCCYK